MRKTGHMRRAAARVRAHGGRTVLSSSLSRGSTTETHFYENNFDARLPLAAGETQHGCPTRCRMIPRVMRAYHTRGGGEPATAYTPERRAAGCCCESFAVVFGGYIRGRLPRGGRRPVPCQRGRAAHRVALASRMCV